MIKLINTNNHHFFHFIETRQGILSKLNFGKLIFINFNEDSLNTRLELRRLLTKNNALNVVLVSEDIALSKLAWKTNVLHTFLGQYPDALEFTYNKGIIHRDIKPSKLF